VRRKQRVCNTADLILLISAYNTKHNLARLAAVRGGAPGAPPGSASVKLVLYPACFVGYTSRHMDGGGGITAEDLHPPHRAQDVERGGPGVQGPAWTSRQGRRPCHGHLVKVGGLVTGISSR